MYSDSNLSSVSVLRRCALLGLVATLSFGHPANVHAGGTPAAASDATSQLLTPGGGQAVAGVGDFISAAPDSLPVDLNNVAGLDDVYRFFIEVPVGATELQVEIFDADILAGGAGDETGERDRNRTTAINTNVKYELFDPAGNRVATRFNFGDDEFPSSSDNAWLLFFDDDTSGITGGDTFLDNFGSASYSNDDGTGGTFAAAWSEVDPGDGSNLPGSGNVQIVSGELCMDNLSAPSPFDRTVSIERELDLSSYSAAEFSFDFTTGTGVDKIGSRPNTRAGDSFLIEISTDGSNYESLEEIAYPDDTVSESRAYDISGYLGATTFIRFRINNRYAGTNENVCFDDVQVRGSTTANGGDPDNGHWEIRVDMASGVNGDQTEFVDQEQDDVNAFGIRAHDGTAGSGGTEYNVYADSVVVVGINNNDGDRDYDYYPYVTSGCDADVNDWDFDSNQPNPPPGNPNVQPFGDLELTSRLATFTHTNSTMSEDDRWNSENFGHATACAASGWTDCDTSEDYGIWQLEVGIEDWDGNNYGPIYINTHEGTTADTSAPPHTTVPTAPTANPEADTFRIYFPTDADAAPAKPFLAQYVNYVDDQSAGPNPPIATGVTNRYAVSVVMTNPSSSLGSITFSASNTITTRFPGSTANATMTYQGVAFVSHGTVTSAPTVGQTTAADIVWNPGTLTTNTQARLVYYVDLNWSTLADTTVTGLPGSNGTTATFVDETGDTVNPRATYDFGELCELTIATGAATQALIAEFKALAIDRQVVLEWQTAAEAGTAGFEVIRLENNRQIRVNQQPLLATLDSPQGGVYRLVDPTATLGQEHSYLLREIEANGRVREFGPYRVMPQFQEPPIGGVESYQRQPHAVPERYFDRLALAAAELPPRLPQRGALGNRLKITITETGLYRLLASDLAPLLGLNEKEVVKMIYGEELSLTHQGQQVAWKRTQLPAGTALDFFAQALDTPFAGENVYHLEVGPGTRMPVRKTRFLPADWGSDTFIETVHVEQNLRPVTLLPLDPESDTWFWTFLQPGGANAVAEFAVASEHLAPGIEAELTIRLQGATDGMQHVLDVEVNGQIVGQVTVDDFAAASPALQFDASFLSDAGNTVRLTSNSGGLVFVDSFDLTYPRWRRPVDDFLISRPDGDRFTTAAPFSEPTVFVFEIDNPLRPVNLSTRVIRELSDFRIIWETRGADTPYLTVGNDAVMTPASIAIDTPSNLLATSNAADYLVIAAPTLVATAQDLADYRQASGLDAMVVDLADIYDEFSHGVQDPRAIRQFLAHATTEWAQSPSYVVLVGAGTYDYRDFLGLGGNLIPTLLTQRSGTLFPTDALYGDLTGDDGIPEVALGRIPVLSAAELQDYLTKLEAYEQSSGDWMSDVLMVSGNGDTFADFGAVSSGFADLLPNGHNITEVDLDSQPDLATARQMLFDGLNAGTSWLSYVGHGGVDRLADMGLLTIADVAGLSNTVTPVISSVTCHIALHGLPGFDSLGEELVLADSAGAIAVFAPAWLSEHSQAQNIGDRLLREAFQRQNLILGDAVIEAMRNAGAMGLPTEVLRAFQILGDPAIEMRLEAMPEEATCEPNCSGPG